LIYAKININTIKGETYKAKTNTKSKDVFKIIKLIKNGKYIVKLIFKGKTLFKKVKITIK